MNAKNDSDRYADAVMARCEGRPVPNIHRLVADAFNAGYVQALQDRANRGSSLRPAPDQPVRLGKTPNGGRIA